MITSETQKPPVGIWGGSVHNWERGKDPFNSDVSGWMALDFWGNQIGFCADGSEVEMAYDSSQDTQKHIAVVQAFLSDIMSEISDRSLFHDASKLKDPEKSMYDEFTPKLASLTYGSDEYKQTLKDMGPALQHHYENNRHHPEHWENGINDMSLLDLIEMLADWKAASMRHANGNITQSVEINRKRFEMSDQLAKIFLNTIIELEW